MLLGFVEYCGEGGWIRNYGGKEYNCLRLRFKILQRDRFRCCDVVSVINPMSPDNPHYWSQQVTQSSSALDLEPGVFTWNDPHKIALSLKRSADSSRRRKAVPFVSAMSMLSFYINRAGKHLPAQQRNVLEKAKDELRKLYGKSPIKI